MYILGISAFYHDSAAALIYDGKVIAAAQEERFSRKKNDPGFPLKAIHYCLQAGKVHLSQLDAIVYYDKPFLKLERILESFYQYAPKGRASFLQFVKYGARDKLFIKSIIRSELIKLGGSPKSIPELYFSQHHLSHAASAYFCSPFSESAILSLDGVGEWETCGMFLGKKNKIEHLKALHYPHSPGLLYAAFTYFLGFAVNRGEYKMMGLAPYGNPKSSQFLKFNRLIREKLIDLKEDGSLWLNPEYFSYSYYPRMIKDRKWEKLFGIARRKAQQKILNDHCDLALAIQRITEEIILKMAAHLHEICPLSNLCLAGGVALNSVANGKLRQSGLFPNIFIQPAAGDAGGALGAALALYHIHFKQSQPFRPTHFDPYLGPAYPRDEILPIIQHHREKFEEVEDEKLLWERCAQWLKEGKVLAWFQGRMEWGPRALGNRSLLADPRNPKMQAHINQNIKKREDFRPFAPVVLAEEVDKFFANAVSSPYMLFVEPIRPESRYAPPQNYSQLDWKDKLAIPRCEIPAVCHVDFSARLQSLDQFQNPRLHGLLKQFHKITDCPALINTSFNRQNEPIVSDPQTALAVFNETPIDILVMENFIFQK